MNQQNTSHFDSQPQQDVADSVEVRSATDVVFAWLAVLIGYLFCRVFPVMFHPFGGLLFIFGLFAVTFIVLGCKKASFGVSPIVFSISALLLAPSLLLSSNALFHFLVFTYAVLVWFYLVYAATGNTLEKGLSDLLFIDFFKAIFIMPFSSLGKIFSTMFGGKGNKGGKNLLKVVLGIIITVIPTAVILILLSYDEAFVALFNKVFELKLTNVFSHGISLVLGVPVGMFLYSAYYAGLNKRCARIITAGGSHDTSSAFKLVPTLTAITATLPILLIYCVFFASQWQYYISAFTGALPETTTFAEYARSGFFQLCIVSVINLLIIIALQFFVSRSDGRTATSTRILCVVFSAATLILIATAVAKLSLYINRYGLTPLRVYAGWFM
ncbi:MAG: DUF4173 domain-containing protein, partial [Firmicutes bacterium]|nr:DUF4173 domain-containing protein [Bacillota bacterium]